MNRGYNTSSGILVIGFNGGESDPNYHRTSGIKQATKL